MTISSNKLQTSLFTTVAFQPQESPAAGKFTAWAKQTKNALEIISNAIGNLWGLNNYLSLELGTIPSIWGVLAKDFQNPGFIPPFPPLDPTKSITVKIVGENTSTNEVFLPIEANETVALSFNGGNAATVFQNKVSTLASAGDWKLSGKHITTYTQIVTGVGESVTCTYRPSANSGWSGTFNRCWAKLVYDNGTTYIEVHADPNDSDFMFRSPFEDSYQAAFSSNPFFSGSLAEGSNLYDEVTRLPSYITQILPGSEVPSGWVRLYSTYTKRIVQNIKFSYPFTTVDGNGVKRILIIEELPDSTIDLSPGSNDYNREYHLLVAGYSVSQALHDLIQKVATLSFLGSAHSELNGLLLTNPSKVRLSSGSQIVGNDHPHYLLRSGYINASDPANEDNAMLGPIKLNRIDYDTTDTGDSYPIMFADAGTIFFDVSEDKVSITGKGLLLNHESAIDASLIVGAKSAGTLTNTIGSKKLKADSFMLRGTEVLITNNLQIRTGTRFITTSDIGTATDYVSYTTPAVPSGATDGPFAGGGYGLQLGSGVANGLNASWTYDGLVNGIYTAHIDIPLTQATIATTAGAPLNTFTSWDIIPGTIQGFDIQSGNQDRIKWILTKITNKSGGVYAGNITFRIIAVIAPTSGDRTLLENMFVQGFTYHVITLGL